MSFLQLISEAIVISSLSRSACSRRLPRPSVMTSYLLSESADSGHLAPTADWKRHGHYEGTCMSAKERERETETETERERRHLGYRLMFTFSKQKIIVTLTIISFGLNGLFFGGAAGVILKKNVTSVHNIKVQMNLPLYYGVWFIISTCGIPHISKSSKTVQITPPNF